MISTDINADANFNADTNTDTNTDVNTKKLKAVYEVLKDKALFKAMVEEQQIPVNELEGFADTIDEIIFDSLKYSRFRDDARDYRDEINSENVKTSTAIELLKQSFFTIFKYKKNEGLVIRALMGIGVAKSSKVDPYIANFTTFIETLEVCKAEFDGYEKDDKLDKVEKLMDELGLNHADLLRRIPENVLKGVKKKTGTTTSISTTSGTTTRTKVTYEHFFVNDSGEIVTGQFSDRSSVADKNKDDTPNGKPGSFFNWAKSECVPIMKRSAFRVGTMTEEKMNEIKAQYRAHIKLAVTESTEPSEMAQ